MRTFITGATGFIGGYLVKRMLQSKHELCCLVRKINETSYQLKQQGVTICLGDITDKPSILRGMKDCDCVIHLAGLYSYWEPKKDAFAKVNIEGTRNVMECVLETGASKVVHVSSVVIFGKPTDSPFTEESLPGPTRFSEYSNTKYEAERIVWDLYNKKKLPVVVVYPSAVLGAGDPQATGKYIMNLIRRRMPATVFDDRVLTFVHVNDVAEVIVRAAEKENNIGERYIAGNQRLSFREINQMVSGISGVPLPKLHLPDALAMVNAAILTGLAGVIKKPPPWGMSTDQISVMREGFRADGSKAERELCISYTPIRMALEEAIASYQS